MKIWVTGANGLLGSTLCSIAPKLCIASTKAQADISDIRSLRQFVKLHPGITHIVNCSAFSLVDLAEKEREEAYKVNALGPENLALLAKEMGARFMHISTDYVFPGDLQRPLKEEDVVGPLNYYGETKLEGEKKVLSCYPSSCVIRTSSIFGKGGKNFVAKLFQLFSQQDEIFLANDQWNSPTFAEDLVTAILQMINAQGLYHFANTGPSTKFLFGSTIFEIAKKKKISLRTKKIIPMPSSAFPSPCKRPAYTVFDTSKIGKLLASPIRSWEEVLESFMVRIL